MRRRYYKKPRLVLLVLSEDSARAQAFCGRAYRDRRVPRYAPSVKSSLTDILDNIEADELFGTTEAALYLGREATEEERKAIENYGFQVIYVDLDNL